MIRSFDDYFQDDRALTADDDDDDEQDEDEVKNLFLHLCSKLALFDWVQPCCLCLQQPHHHDHQNHHNCHD